MNRFFNKYMALSTVASFGAVAMMISAGNEVNIPGAHCRQNADGSYSMYNRGNQGPSYEAQSLVSVPESDLSFSTSKVFNGETIDGYALTVILDADKTGECRVQMGDDHLDPTLVYSLNTPN